MVDQPLMVFRSDFRRAAKQSAPFWGSLGLLLVVVALIGPLLADSSPLFSDLAAAILVGLAASLAITVLFGLRLSLCPVKLYAGGLRCCNLLGIRRTVLWEDMALAEVGRPYGLPCMDIQSRGNLLPIAVPLALRDMSAFRRLVARHAGSGNPLAQALETAED